MNGNRDDLTGKRNIKDLHPHAENAAIYGDTERADPDLVIP